MEVGMKFETEKYGTIEVIEIFTICRIIVKFLNTGTEVVTTKRKVEAGKVIDSVAQAAIARKGKYEAVLHTGEVVNGHSLLDLSEKLGISHDMMRSINSGRVGSRIISTIKKIK